MSYEYVKLDEINPTLISKKIHIVGRLHALRNKSKLCFIILRKQIHSLQCIVDKSNVNIEKFNELFSVSDESYVELFGELKSAKNIKACSYHECELLIDDFKIISRSLGNPFTIDNANTFDKNSTVLQNTRLDNRYFDLRTPLNYCIFTMQSNITQLFREFLLRDKFMEIHSPKLISTASESGASVFPVKFYDKTAYLAQSPQFYKQMSINSDFERVFEIGPVFRAENSLTHRHLCEFIGLDIEMVIEPNQDYHVLIRLIWDLLNSIFSSLKKYTGIYSYIKENYDFEELVVSVKPVILTFKEGVELLRKNNYTQLDYADLSTENEKKLGSIVKQLYGTDLFVLTQYPKNVRPFYTMPNGEYSNSFDVILRGEEISSGSQRIHDYNELKNRITELGISYDSIKDYMQSFSSGSKPMAGCGFGLERILMLYFDLQTVKRTSLYPRDPNRLNA